MSNNQRVWVIIPAAGIGKRMQSSIPKQYLKIDNRTILEHTLNCFISHADIAGIIVVLNSDDYYWKTVQKNLLSKSKPVYTVEGGTERSDSVMQGIDYLLMIERIHDNSWIMVHDAARPCLLKKDIDALLSVRNQSSAGGLLASPVRDTMKRAIPNSKKISRTESRDNLWHALTPQLFRIGELKEALEHCLEKGIEVTDEASALEAVGKSVLLIEGSSNNIKVTQTDDLELATLLLTSPSFFKEKK